MIKMETALWIGLALIAVFTGWFIVWFIKDFKNSNRK